MYFLRNWQVTFLLYTLGVFMSEYIAKASIEPRDYRVVFLIQKEQTVFIHLLFKGFQFFLQENIFQNKQNRQHIHQCTDLLIFEFACEKVNTHVGENSHGNTFGNAV